MKDNHRYSSLQTIHEEKSDYDGLESEVEDWRRGPEIRARRNHRSWEHWITHLFLVLVIIGLLYERGKSSFESGRETTGDVTGFAPKFSQKIVSFSRDPRFGPDNASEFWSKETQDAWLSIVPRALGYVVVKEPEKYEYLPTPIHDYKDKTVYTTSMTHQLHCLYTILEHYNALTSSMPMVSPQPAWHITHCFDYLRQAIMCAGDVALEGAETTFPWDRSDPTMDMGGSDGWDAKHVCKDHQQILGYLEENRANDDRWI